MRTVRVTALLTTLVLLGLAPAARADGTVSENATTITYQAQAGDADRFTMAGLLGGVRFDPGVTSIGFPEDGVPINPGLGSGCASPSAGVARCPFVGQATLDLGDRADVAAVIGDAGLTPATTVHGASGDDMIVGQGSAPLTLLGEADNDLLADGTAADSLDGGSGDDTLRYLAGGADDLRGGSGTDSVQFNPATPAVVSLDNVANDGPAGTANVHSDIEVVNGTPLGDRLTGGAGPNTLNGNGGADVITARDGAADTIDCGAGTDTAVVDVADVVTNCETVQRSDAVGGDNTGGSVLPKVAAEVRVSWKLSRTAAKVGKLVVSKVPARGKVEVRCTGKGCAFSRKRAPVKARTATLTKLFKGRKLKPGAVVEVRITAPAMTGKVLRFTVRKGKKAPTRSALCLAAGAAKPAACS